MAEAKTEAGAAPGAQKAPPQPVRGQSGAFNAAFYLRQLVQVRDQGAIFTLAVSTGENERIFFFTRGAILFSAAGVSGGPILYRKLLAQKLIPKEKLDSFLAETDTDCPLLQDVIREKNALDPQVLAKVVEDVLEEYLVEVALWDSTIAFYDMVQGNPPARLYSKDTPAVRLSLGLAGLLGRVIPKVTDAADKILRPLGGTLKNRVRKVAGAAPSGPVEAAILKAATEEGKRCQHLLAEAHLAGFHPYEAGLALAALVQQRKLILDEVEATKAEELASAAKIEKATDDFLNGLLSSMHLAGIYERAEDNEKAVDQYRAVAGEYSVRDRFQEALLALKNAIRLGPADLAAREDMVKALRNAGRVPEASGEAVELGRILLARGLPGRARKAFELAAKLMPKSLGVLWMLSGLLERLGEKEEAIKQYRNIAQLSQAQGDKAGYLAAEQKLLELDPQDATALKLVRSYSGYGRALFVRFATAGAAVLATVFVLSWGLYESLAGKALGETRDKAIAAIDEDRFDPARSFVNDFKKSWSLSRAAKRADTLIELIDAEEAVAKDRKVARALRLARSLDAEKRTPEAAEVLRDALKGEDRKDKRDLLESAALRCEQRLRQGKEAILEARRLHDEKQSREAHDKMLQAFEDFPWLAKPGSVWVPCLVESVPSGAQVSVDGAPVEGTTPVVAMLPLNPIKLGVILQNREHVVQPVSPLPTWPIVVRLPRMHVWTVADAVGQSAPALAEGLVVATCDDRTAVAVDRESGSVKWRTPLGIFDDSDLPPAIVGNTVVVRTNLGAVIGLEISSGRELWRRAVKPPPGDLSDPAAGRPVAAGDGVLVRDGPSGLVLLAASDGALRWSVLAKGQIVGAPLATAKLAVCVSGRSAQSFKLAGGAAGWTAPLPITAVTGPVAGPRGAVVVGLETSALQWIDEAGTPAGLDRAVVNAALSAIDGSASGVVAGSVKGELVAFDGPGKPAFHRPGQGSAVKWVRAVSKDVVLEGDAQGITCLDGKGGEQWRDPTNGSPAQADDAKVYQPGPAGLSAISR